MKKAAQREHEFIAALTALLREHGAELQVTDDGKSFGMQSSVCVISMDSQYENEGPCIAEYAEFNLPTWIG